jgi:hypothetical protein
MNIVNGRLQTTDSPLIRHLLILIFALFSGRP